MRRRPHRISIPSATEFAHGLSPKAHLSRLADADLLPLRAVVCSLIARQPRADKLDARQRKLCRADAAFADALTCVTFCGGRAGWLITS